MLICLRSYVVAQLGKLETTSDLVKDANDQFVTRNKDVFRLVVNKFASGLPATVPLDNSLRLRIPITIFLREAKPTDVRPFTVLEVRSEDRSILAVSGSSSDPISFFSQVNDLDVAVITGLRTAYRLSDAQDWCDSLNAMSFYRLWTPYVYRYTVDIDDLLKRLPVTKGR